jgi:DNA-binding transcriptional MerR regulator
MEFATSEYTEAEAAEKLGVSIDQLRAMVRMHILQEDGDPKDLSMTVFQRSDLLILRLFLEWQSGDAGVIRS